MLSFSTEQFFSVFKLYNSAVGVGVLVFYTGSILSAFLLYQRSKNSNVIALRYLALLWLWMGVVYHWFFFANINPAAKLFGAFFVVQALLFARGSWQGIKLQMAPLRSTKGVFQFGCIFYSLSIYPLIGALLGHGFPHGPILGLPCPSTIFTFGILSAVNSDRRSLIVISAIPILWSVVGTYAAMNLGVYEDYALLLSALVFAATSLVPKTNN